MALEPNARIILASSSPRRRELLQSLQLAFDVRSPRADEHYDATRSPANIVEYLSRKKAQSVVDEVLQAETLEEDVLVIGSDTIVVNEGRILGKPANTVEAARMLTELSGGVHDVYSGLALFILRQNRETTTFVGHRRTSVRFKPLDQALIERYVATGEPLDKAGAYAIQGWGATLVEKIDGDYFTVVGFPLGLFADFLTLAGYRFY